MLGLSVSIISKPSTAWGPPSRPNFCTPHWRARILHHSLVQQVWNTRRLVQYGSSYHDEVLVSNCTPQGCPFAPLVLSCWMLSGHCHVEKDLMRQGHTKNDLNKSHTTIYMDDRSFCDSNIPRLLDRADAWLRWSTMTNLLENTNKIQAVARTKQKQNQLADLRPEWTGQAETTIRGITLTLERRRNSENRNQTY